MLKVESARLPGCHTAMMWQRKQRHCCRTRACGRQALWQLTSGGRGAGPKGGGRGRGRLWRESLFFKIRTKNSETIAQKFPQNQLRDDPKAPIGTATSHRRSPQRLLRHFTVQRHFFNSYSSACPQCGQVVSTRKEFIWIFWPQWPQGRP